MQVLVSILVSILIHCHSMCLLVADPCVLRESFRLQKGGWGFCRGKERSAMRASPASDGFVNWLPEIAEATCGKESLIFQYSLSQVRSHPYFLLQKSSHVLPS